MCFGQSSSGHYVPNLKSILVLHVSVQILIMGRSNRRTEPSMITTPRYSKPVIRFMRISEKKKHTTKTTHMNGTVASTMSQ